MTDKERFIKAIEWLKTNRKIFNNADLAAVLDVSQTYVSLLYNGKKPITDNLVKNLVNKFPELNREWLLTGEGVMTKIDATAQSWEEAEDKEREKEINRLKKELSDLREKVAQLQEDKSNLSDTVKSLSRTLEAISQTSKKS